MDLYPSDGNPIPSESIVSAVRTKDGLMLRVARWPAPGVARGTVLVGMGRSEFIEQYGEIVAELRRRRFDVVVFDWRGQGQSDRQIQAARKGYVRSFREYRRDLDAVEQQILKPFAPRPWFALGHSMGAAVLLGQAHDGDSPFERLVLSAPLIDLPVGRSARRAVRWLDRLGFGRLLVPGGRQEPILLRRTFEGNVLTSDPEQFRRLATSTRQLPHLAVGSPTIAWAAAAFRQIEHFAQPAYPIETLTPILVLVAGRDAIVDTAATERFALKLKAGRCLTIPGSRHQLIMERPDVMAQVWAAFDAFVPGFEATRAEAAQAQR